MSIKYDVDYFHKTYSLTLPHTEIVEAAESIKPCSAFDLGCGQGRNSLYLSSLGFDVTSVDVNSNSINFLQDVIAKEGINNIQSSVYDINLAKIEGQFDFIFQPLCLCF